MRICELESLDCSVGNNGFSDEQEYNNIDERDLMFFLAEQLGPFDDNDSEAIYFCGERKQLEHVVFKAPEATKASKATGAGDIALYELNIRMETNGIEIMQTAQASTIFRTTIQEPLVLAPVREECNFKLSSSGTETTTIHSQHHIPSRGLNLQMKFELHRFFTFTNSTKLDYGRKRDWANSGFFVTSDQSVVECWYCYLKIYNFSTNNDQVQKTHADTSPKCEYVVNHAAALGSLPTVGHDLNLTYQSHRLYTMLMRMTCESGVDPFELASNGFYWTGIDDHSRCYCCGLEIRGWEKKDVVSVEHRKYNPRCLFVNNMEKKNSIESFSSMTTNIIIGDEENELYTSIIDDNVIHAFFADNKRNNYMFSN